jgi:succinyl-CoA synthetase alpha subunit
MLIKNSGRIIMILVNENTKCLVQGITGKEGSFHTEQMLNYNTKIVAGVTPGKGGQTLKDVPVFNTIEEAKENVEINTSIIFVPSSFAKDAAFESIKHLDLVIIITEHIPAHDSMEIIEYAKKNNTMVIGPNTPGIISPGIGKIGIMPTHIFSKGNVGVISRSGTLTYEIATQLTMAGIGQSTCLGIGGDSIIGTNYSKILEEFENDKQTDYIIMIGEIGGSAEEIAAEYIKENISKPVISYIAGITAPPGKRMGHAGAIIEGKKGTAKNKKETLRNAGVNVVDTPSQIVDIIKKLEKS